MSSSTIPVLRIDAVENEISLCRSSILSCEILMSSESTLPSQSTRSAMWTFDSTHGATHSGSDLDEWTFQSPLHIPPSGVYKVNLLEGNLIYPCPTMVNPLMEQQFHVPLSTSKFVGKKPWAIILNYTPRTKKPHKLVIRLPPLIGYQVTNLNWLIVYQF